jgi:hypothetical protein
VIVITHEPNWLTDWYWSDVTGKNISHLICDYLKGRCKLRMAGDLHHYMRHSHVKSDGPVHVHHLLVNGCGGAFLHPTHVFSKFDKLDGVSYECKAAYPSFEDSSRVCRMLTVSYYIPLIVSAKCLVSIYVDIMGITFSFLFFFQFNADCIRKYP